MYLKLDQESEQQQAKKQPAVKEPPVTQETAKIDENSN